MSRLVLMIAVPALAVLLLCGCTQEKKQPEVRQLEKIRFCQGGHLSLLVDMATEKGYFAEQGLEAVIMKLGDGKSAMEAFLGGECTFGIMGDPPVVKQALVRDDFAVIASLSNSANSTKILARKDRGISEGKDLKGKRIGVKSGVSSQIFAELYLKKKGIALSEVTFQAMDLKDMPSALMTGDIDAYSSSNMYLLEGKRLLGNRAQVLSEPGFCLTNNYLTAKRELLAAQPELTRRVIRALAQAEKSLAENPQEARALIARTLKVSPADAESILNEENHTLTLGQRQIDSLAMHANWMIDRGTAGKKPLPDFHKLIDLAPFDSLKQGAAAANR